MTIARNQPGLVTNASKYLQFEGDFTGSAEADTDGLVKVAVTLSDAAKTGILGETKEDIDALKADRIAVVADGGLRGLKGDGVTDNQEALQALIDAGADKGTEIVIPAGDYIFNGPVYARSRVTLRLASGCRLLKNYATQGAPTDALGVITNENGTPLQGFCILGEGVIAQTAIGGGKLLSLWCDDMHLRVGIGRRRVRPGTGDGWAFMLGGDRMKLDVWGTEDPDYSNGHGGLDGVHIIGGRGMTIDVRNVRSGDDSLAFVPVESLTGTFAAWNHASIIGARFTASECYSTHARIAVAGIVANALGSANTTSVIRDIEGVVGGTATALGDADNVAGVGVIGTQENFDRNQIRDIRFRGSVDPNGEDRTVTLSYAHDCQLDIRIEDDTEDVARIHNTTDCSVRIVSDMSGGTDQTSDICVPTGVNTRLALHYDIVAPDTDGATRQMLRLGQSAADPMIDCDVSLRLRRMGNLQQAIRVGPHYSGRVTLVASEKDEGATGTVGFNLDPAANAVITADSDLSLVDNPLSAPDSADAGGNIIARGIKGLSGLLRTSPALANAEVWGLHSVNMTGCAASVFFLPGSATIVDLQVSMDRGGTWRSIGADTRFFELPAYAWVRSLHSGGTVTFRATVL